MPLPNMGVIAPGRTITPSMIKAVFSLLFKSPEKGRPRPLFL